MIGSLTDAQRTAATLRYGRDLPVTAIAEQMGRSEGAAKLLLDRGLAAVRIGTSLRDINGRSANPHC